MVTGSIKMERHIGHLTSAKARSCNEILSLSAISSRQIRSLSAASLPFTNQDLCLYVLTRSHSLPGKISQKQSTNSRTPFISSPMSSVFHTCVIGDKYEANCYWLSDSMHIYFSCECPRPRKHTHCTTLFPTADSGTRRRTYDVSHMNEPDTGASFNFFLRAMHSDLCNVYANVQVRDQVKFSINVSFYFFL